MTEAPRPVASARHTWTILGALAAITAVSAASFRARMGSAGTESHVQLYVVLALSEWLLALGVWRGLKAYGTSLTDILGVGATPGRPRVRLAVLGVAVLPIVRVCAWGAARGLTAAFGAHSERDSMRVTAAVQPHGPLECALWVVVSISAGICEEFVYRGYLQRQFSAWFRGPLPGIVASAAVFGVAHAYQGGWQVVVIVLGFGLPLGLLAWATRSIVPGMVAHALQDTIAGLTRFG